MRACWPKWVGRDWSISADYIWLNYSDANTIRVVKSRHKIQTPEKGASTYADAPSVDILFIIKGQINS